MEIVSNLLLVSENSIDALDLLKLGGYSQRDAEKAVVATGFNKLSRFSQMSVTSLIRENQSLFRAQVEPFHSAISVVIVVTQSNGQVIPNAASVMQDALNLPQGTICIEIVEGCNGFVKALKIADSLLESDGICAVLAGDLNSKMVKGAESGTAALFGDGYALTLVKKAGDFHGELRQDGSSGTAIQFGDENPNMVMDGFRIFAFSSDAVPKLISQYIGGHFSKNRFVVLHQASRLIVELIAKKAGTSSSGYPSFNAENLGNLGPASIPGWFACQASIPKGSQAFCVGYGAGLSWGYARITWNAEFNEVVYV